jgi:hypothetical protein
MPLSNPEKRARVEAAYQRGSLLRNVQRCAAIATEAGEPASASAERNYLK